MTLDILIFGGNGFIGSHVSEAFLAQGHNLTLVNRNRWPWDTASTIRPKIDKLVLLDRTEARGVKIFLDEVVGPRLTTIDPQRPFDLVVDLSAYEPGAVEPYAKILAENHLARWYLFVSTDSVYEVCDLGEEILSGKRSIREQDAVRAADENSMHFDPYGHEKLRIEELLGRLRNESPRDYFMPYLVLRLPDVLGPRDSTLRWWKYQIWMENFELLGAPNIVIPSFAETRPTSYVYVKDIAKFMLYVVDLIARSQNLHKITDQTYNFALGEPQLLSQLLLYIKQASGAYRAVITNAKEPLRNDSIHSDIFFFPSVTKGGLDVRKFEENFPDFHMSDWSTVVHETVDFYKKASLNFPPERDETARKLCHDLNIDTQKCDIFLIRLLVDAAKKMRQEL